MSGGYLWTVVVRVKTSCVQDETRRGIGSLGPRPTDITVSDEKVSDFGLKFLITVRFIADSAFLLLFSNNFCITFLKVIPKL